MLFPPHQNGASSDLSAILVPGERSSQGRRGRPATTAGRQGAACRSPVRSIRPQPPPPSPTQTAERAVMICLLYHVKLLTVARAAAAAAGPAAVTIDGARGETD